MRWADVLVDKSLRDLPYKIALYLVTGACGVDPAPLLN